MKNKINIDYNVGDLIYNAKIYDGINTFLFDLPFYKKWLPQDRGAKILEFAVELVDLRFQ